MNEDHGFGYPRHGRVAEPFQAPGTPAETIAFDRVGSPPAQGAANPRPRITFATRQGSLLERRSAPALAVALTGQDREIDERRRPGPRTGGTREVCFGMRQPVDETADVGGKI